MGFTVLKSKIVTTRKPHGCFGCGLKLPAGTRMQYTFGVEDGTPYSGGYYLCMHCYDYTLQHQDVWGDPDEGVDWGFVREYRKDQPLSVNGA